MNRRQRIRLRPLLPVLLAALAIGLFPLADTLYLSLRHRPDGFHALFADAHVWKAARTTLVLVSIALPVELLFGLALALLFRKPMPGKAVFVALLALPALVAPVIGGSAWRILFNNDYGPLNQVLGWFVAGPVMTLWLQNPRFALPAVLIADIWQWTPFMFVLLLAGFSRVDRRQLEAAAIADAGPWRTFFTVVFPVVWPALVIATLIRGLDLARLFDVAWVLTRGGPDSATETLSVFAYNSLAEAPGARETAALAFTALFAFALAWGFVLAVAGRAR